MKFLLFTLIFVFFLNQINGSRFCAYYNENSNGENVLISRCVLPNGELQNKTIIATSGSGDGKGLIGNDRVVVVGKCLFASNDLDQSVSHFKIENECDPNPVLVGETLIQPVNEKCNKHSIDDMSLAVSGDKRCLFVGMGDILEKNNLYSFTIDLQNCSITRADMITSPNWLTFLPYRINGLSVSYDNKFVGVGFTSGFGAQAIVEYDSNNCKFKSDFTTIRDSAQPGLSTKTIFSKDSNGRNVLLTSVADNRLQKGILDARSVDSFLNTSSLNQVIIPSLADSVTLSIVFSIYNSQQVMYVAEPEGGISIINIGNDGKPQNGSDRKVANLTNGGRITGLQVSESGELVVSQSAGFTIFRIDTSNGNLSKLGDYMSGKITYGNSGLFQLPRCCWDGNNAINFNGESEKEIDCADDLPPPQFTTSPNNCSPSLSEVKHTISTCGNLPNVIYNITAKTCCDRYQKNFVQRIVRKDTTAPSILIINDEFGNYGKKFESEELYPIGNDCTNNNFVRNLMIKSNQEHTPKKNSLRYSETNDDDYETPNENNETPNETACKNLKDCLFIDGGLDFVETYDDCSNLQNLSTSINNLKRVKCDPLTKIYGNGEILFNAKDSCGNTKSATHKFQLKDLSLPIVEKYEPEVVLSICEDIKNIDKYPYNVCTLNISDTCTNVTCQIVSASNDTSVCKPVTRTYIVTDECGNKSEFKRVFKRKETMMHYVKRSPILAIEETDVCLKDSYNVSYGFFESHIPCVNPDIISHPPVTVVNSTCFSIQIHCKTLKTDCVELCSCIPVRVNSLPIILHTNQKLNVHQQDLDLVDGSYTFQVTDFEVPTVKTPCGEIFNATQFVVAGGNITVVYFVVGEIQLIPESISIYNHKRELRVVYLFDNGCDYEMIPTAESYFVVQGTKHFLENIFIPSKQDFQNHLLESFGLINMVRNHSKRTQSFKISTGRFSVW